MRVNRIHSSRGSMVGPNNDHPYARRREADRDLYVLQTEFHNFRQQYHRDELRRSKFEQDVETDVKNILKSLNHWGGVVTGVATCSAFIGALIGLGLQWITGRGT